jgi:hypothetical protein
MKPSFVEAAIYIASGGEYAGKYIAACAKDECGYVGESHLCTFLSVHMVLTRHGPSASGEVLQARPRRNLCSPRSVCLTRILRVLLTNGSVVFGERVPPRVMRISETRSLASSANPRPLKRTYAMLGVPCSPPVIHCLTATVATDRRRLGCYPPAPPTCPSPEVSYDGGALTQTRCQRATRHL